jgi:hypothetical protein
LRRSGAKGGRRLHAAALAAAFGAHRYRRMTDYLKQVKDLLRQEDFEFVRHGKGSHDAWNAKTGKSLPYRRKGRRVISQIEF